MEILSRAEFERRMPLMLEEMRGGKLFVYPTDTIYGMGCDATNPAAVGRVRLLKRRDRKPFSVIAPSLGWITSNCIVGRKERDWLARLPGPYTLIMRLSNRASVSPPVTEGLGTLGVRMPDNWFSAVVARAGIPFVTTSVNMTGKPFMTSLADIEPSIRDSADYIIDIGALKNRPSRVVDLASGKSVRE